MEDKPEEDRSYPYSDFIRSPAQMGASPKGSLEALNKDISVLKGYVDVMISGTGNAQTVKGPLGNKYFLTTNTDCKDAQGVAHPRFVFINNIPVNVIPGVEYRGLVPGIVQDVLYINPGKLFSVFTQSDLCRKVTMQTRDIKNTEKMESQYVLDDDLITYPPDWFVGGVHPVTGVKSGTQSSGSKGKDKKKKKKENFTTEQDLPEIVYFISVGVLVLYLLLKLSKKTYVQGILTKLKQSLLKW
jgi:hypothetical protein